MTRSKQDSTPLTLSACLTRKGWSVVMAATAFSSRREGVQQKTAHHSERERRFPSHFGCGSAAACGGPGLGAGALGPFRDVTLVVVVVGQDAVVALPLPRPH